MFQELQYARRSPLPYKILENSELDTICVGGNWLVEYSGIAWPITSLTFAARVCSLPDLEPGNNVSLPKTSYSTLVSDNGGHVYIGCWGMASALEISETGNSSVTRNLTAGERLTGEWNDVAEVGPSPGQVWVYYDFYNGEDLKLYLIETVNDSVMQMLTLNSSDLPELNEWGHAYAKVIMLQTGEILLRASGRDRVLLVYQSAVTSLTNLTVSGSPLRSHRNHSYYVK